MIRTMSAELAKLCRRRVLIGAAITTVVFAVGGALIVLAATVPAGAGNAAGHVRPTFQSLATAGGGTEVFTTAVSFAGTFLFVVFVGMFAVDYSRGTFRTMLLRQPGRIRLLAGKLVATLSFAAVVLAVTEVVTWLVAYVAAPSYDVDRSAWTSLSALGSAGADFARVLGWVSGYAVLALMVAVLLRSVPVALAVGIAWAGPLEHLISDAWTPAFRTFPGLLLEAFVAGGTADVTAGRALLTLSIYVAIAGAIAATVFSRRDVTA